MSRFAPVTETTAADWIVAALLTFGESVLSLIPGGFAAYVRVFHPAYRLDHESPCPGEASVAWADIAAANGTRSHPAMQLCSLTGSYAFLRRAQAGVYDEPPAEGSLPLDLARALAVVLARYTATPDRCWFAVWHGFGGIREDVRAASTFGVPGREYFLLGGPVDVVTESATEGRQQSPSLWWPDDRAWCVATEIDLNTTYIGCSGACRDEILRSPALEASAIDPASGIGWTSDLVNPEPQPDESDRLA